MKMNLSLLKTYVHTSFIAVLLTCYQAAKISEIFPTLEATQQHKVHDLPPPPNYL